MISQRARLPLKVATALCLAIVTALWLGWERPYWAAFAVIVMAATETAGHSLRKGRHRLLGTLFGVVMAIVLAGLFPQQPSYCCSVTRRLRHFVCITKPIRTMVMSGASA
ncbi:hypothetical protein JCM19237_5133 [Photobacterium aphoticum]|uniref:Uncharacterized protein n=1 Tax=Photobacterium aphoticum TaxID=754436 RepID=A0A090QGG6_9GAMM|nr:hypothetical protein JCM19237_5133 [Photobacterium aphoticum]